MARSEDKTFSVKGEQGDIRFRLVPRNSMPGDAREAEKVCGKYVVASSETHHHHVVDCTQAILYETADPFTAFLVLAEESESAICVHQKTGEHVHGDARLLNKGADFVWKVSRQREYFPEGLRKAAD